MDTYEYMFHGSPDHKLWRQGDSQECAEHGHTNCRRCEEGHVDRTARYAELPLSSTTGSGSRIGIRPSQAKKGKHT